MIVKPESMDFSKQRFSAIIYGSPGVGKTTLALSAPAPILIDFDRGVSRVRAQHRKDNLSSRYGEIEGLSDFVATFADGSPQSAAMIAGLAKASNKDLETMVAHFNDLQVSEESAKESLALATAGIEEDVDKLISEMEQDIQDMDFSDAAAQAGIDTIQSYINAAEGKLPAVQAAYAKLGAAAQSALENHTNTAWSGSYFDIPGRITANHFATGTSRAPRGAAWVGEHGPELMFMRGGETVLNARETEALMQQYAELRQVANGVDIPVAKGPVTTYPGPGGGGNPPVSIQVQVEVSGNATAETAEALNESAERIAELAAEKAVEMMEDMKHDAERTAYR